MAHEDNIEWYMPEEILLNSKQDVENLLSNMTGISVKREIYYQMISDDLMQFINIYANILLCGSIALFGTFNNIVNMIVFFQMGIKDSMSICLFALSLTDFLLSFLVMTSRAFPIWETFFNTALVDPMAVWYVAFAWLTDSLFVCSGWITTFLAFERCICVTFPFKVKQIFTRKRSIIAILTMYLFVAGVYIPIYATNNLEWIDVQINTGNRTSILHRLVVTFSENRPEIQYYVEHLSVTVLTVPSLFIILGSVFSMVYGLQMSSYMRDSMTASRWEGAKEDSKITNKTRRLVKVVLFLAIIFTICSIPRYFATYMGLFHPEVHEGGKERNLYTFQWQFARFASTVNASVNFFVYLKINSSYRSNFQEIFSIRSKQSRQ